MNRLFSVTVAFEQAETFENLVAKYSLAPENVIDTKENLADPTDFDENLYFIVSPSTNQYWSVDTTGLNYTKSIANFYGQEVREVSLEELGKMV
jgi:hypothetical protein